MAKHRRTNDHLVERPYLHPADLPLHDRDDYGGFPSPGYGPRFLPNPQSVYSSAGSDQDIYGNGPYRKPHRMTSMQHFDQNPSMYDHGNGHAYSPTRGASSAELRHRSAKQHRSANDGPDDRRMDQSSEQQGGIGRLFSVYANKCSMNGVIFIKQSKYKVVKAIWALLLLGCLSFMVYHLYRLTDKYYEYDKESKIDLKFESLPFPAVTVCNVNPIRQSELYRASAKLNALIVEINPDKLREQLDDWEPEYEEHSGEYFDGDDDEYDENNDDDNARRRKRRSTDDSDSASGVRTRNDNFLDGFNRTFEDDIDLDDFSGDTYTDSWESESEPAAFDQIATRFTNLYSKENTTTRALMGHQVQDMLVQCSFSGRKCLQSNFTRVQTTTLGNCYTIEYSKFISRGSGPQKGLSLMLFLETDEYVPGVTNSKGVQVVVHDQSTLPFPDDEGFVVSAGTEALVGLRRISISRLGKPFGNCTDTAQFRKKYKIKYTRQACQAACQFEQIMNICGCYDATEPSLASLFSNLGEACQENRDSSWCLEDVLWQFQSNSSACGCDSPCNEIQYRKTISSKSWPNPKFAQLIAGTICKEKGRLCNASETEELILREQFVKLNVFYETLNYQKMSEEADYTEFQFISDIGGTVGLYVGLSVLSMFEIFHLIISIFGYLMCRK